MLQHMNVEERPLMSDETKSVLTYAVTQIAIFCCGTIVIMNLMRLWPADPVANFMRFEVGWWKVALALCIAVGAGIIGWRKAKKVSVVRHRDEAILEHIDQGFAELRAEVRLGRDGRL